MNTLIPSTIDDIVFEHRNRAYGAYMLRQLYQPTLTRAAIIGIGLFLVAVSAPTLYARLVDRNAKQEIMVETNLEKVKLEPLPEKVIEIPPVEKLPTVSTVRSMPPEVMPDEEVEAPTLPPTVDELAEADPAKKRRKVLVRKQQLLLLPKNRQPPPKPKRCWKWLPGKKLRLLTWSNNPNFLVAWPHWEPLSRKT